MIKININESLQFEVEENGEGFEINGSAAGLDVKKISDTSFHVIKDSKSYRVSVIENNGKEMLISVNGTKYNVDVEDRFDILLQRLGMDLPGAGLVEDLMAPMPGLVLDINVSAGDEVKKDQQLMVLEAMKMENVLKAPADAVVKEVHVKKQEAVEKNQLLISFEE